MSNNSLDKGQKVKSSAFRHYDGKKEGEAFCNNSRILKHYLLFIVLNFKNKNHLGDEMQVTMMLRRYMD